MGNLTKNLCTKFSFHSPVSEPDAANREGAGTGGCGQRPRRLPQHLQPHIRAIQILPIQRGEMLTLIQSPSIIVTLLTAGRVS